MTTSDEQILKVLFQADGSVDGVATSYIKAIERFRANIDYTALEDALLLGDDEAAKRAIAPDMLDPFLYGLGIGVAASFVELLQDVFIAGAKTAIVELIEMEKKAPAFDILGQRAVESMRRNVAEAVKSAIKTTAEGVDKLLTLAPSPYGTVQRQAAQLVNLIGLDANQVVSVMNYRKQLEERKIFDLTNPANRRIDPLDRLLVRHQMGVGGLSQQQIDGLVDRYSKSLIEQRALTIARTETMSMVNAGRQELWEQALDQGAIDDDDVRKFWVTTPDDRLRATHAAIPNMNQGGVAIRSFFVTPFGNVYGPQDRKVELINCRCIVVLQFI